MVNMKKILSANILVFIGIFISYKLFFVPDWKRNNDKKYAGTINYTTDDSRKTILQFIVKQFDEYRKDGINIEDIEALGALPKGLRDEIGIKRIQIIDGRVSTIIDKGEDHSPFHTIFAYALNRVTDNHKIKNVDFWFLYKDFMPAADKLDEKTKKLLMKLPILVMSKNLENPIEKNKILVPDCYLMGYLKWRKLYNTIPFASSYYKWDKKIPKIFWRGITTGNKVIYNLENYSEMPRISLVMMSNIFPDLIDAKFSSYSQFNDKKSSQNLFKIIKKVGFDRLVPPEDHLAYKYLISVDGNTCAWLRVPWIMLSNSVLVKQETQKIQLFYPAMIPYVHYVPAKEDLSDLIEKIRWMQNNDDKAFIISENATKFVESCLKQEYLDEYLAIILNEYHNLQNFKVTKQTEPNANYLE